MRESGGERKTKENKARLKKPARIALLLEMEAQRDSLFRHLQRGIGGEPLAPLSRVGIVAVEEGDDDLQED